MPGNDTGGTSGTGNSTNTDGKEQALVTALNESRDFQLFITGLNIESGQNEALTDFLDDVGDRIAN